MRLTLVPQLKTFAQSVGMHPNHLSRLERLVAGSTESTVELLSKALRCQPADIIQKPDEQRLQQIAIDFQQYKLDQAKAKAVGQ